MGILPEDTAAAHIGKLLNAAYEAGLPVPISIPPHNVKRFILSAVSLADVMECDHSTIDQSIRLWQDTRKAGQSFGPWHIANTILKKRDDAHKARHQTERKDASSNVLANAIAENRRRANAEQAEKDDYEAWVASLSVTEIREMTNKWAERAGNPKRMPASSVVLRWAWKEKRNARTT
ncbi:MAG: hypothetical protein GY807_24795 [Gammaproteobacteria bacterium]|nr:hypothetical protein [Gammaproteobacteria bacterium]